MVDILGIEALVGTAILILYILSAHIIELKKITFIHESGLAIVLGFICGVIIYHFGGRAIKFDDNTFFYFILPPIILAAGYTLKRKHFISNIGYILIFGFFGTLCSMVVHSGLIYGTALLLNGQQLHFSLADSMLLATVLCATDSVASVAIVKEEAYPKLNSIMFGESVINDAVSIIIFQTVKGMMSMGKDGTEVVDLSGSNIAKGIGIFFYVTICSILLGTGFGLIISAILKNIKSLRHNAVFEVTLIMLFGYMSYIIAEISDLSGIMTIFCAAFTMSHYAYYNISEKSKHATSIVFKTTGFIAEAFVFGYLGMITCTLAETKVDILFSIWVFFMSMIGRAATLIFPIIIVYIVKRGDMHGMTCKYLTMLWYAGLIKGAVAFALALTMSTGSSDILQSTTLLIVLFSTLVVGGIIPLFGMWVGIKSEAGRAASKSGEGEDFNKTEQTIPLLQNVPKRRGRFHQWWRGFDDRFVKKIFGGRDKRRPSLIEGSDASQIVEGINESKRFNEIEERKRYIPINYEHIRRREEEGALYPEE